MNFTEILESYQKNGLKGIVSLVEEPDQETFDKEFKKHKAKAEGKIVNKHITTPTVIATKDQNEIEKEDGIKEDNLNEYEIIRGKDGRYYDDEGNVSNHLPSGGGRYMSPNRGYYNDKPYFARRRKPAKSALLTPEQIKAINDDLKQKNDEAEARKAKEQEGK